MSGYTADSQHLWKTVLIGWLILNEHKAGNHSRITLEIKGDSVTMSSVLRTVLIYIQLYHPEQPYCRSTRPVCSTVPNTGALALRLRSPQFTEAWKKHQNQRWNRTHIKAVEKKKLDKNEWQFPGRRQPSEVGSPYPGSERWRSACPHAAWRIHGRKRRGLSWYQNSHHSWCLF